MRTTVQGPDGGYVTVEHPEGATDDQIIQFAQANYRPTPVPIGREGLTQAAREVGQAQSPLEGFATGIGAAAHRAWLGLGTILTGGPNEAQREALQVASATQSGAGLPATVGNVATNVGAALALPGAALSTIPRSAAYAAAVEPEERIKAGLLTAGLGLGIRGLTGAPLVQPTAAQQRLLAQGVTPTLGQAGESSGTRLGRMGGAIEQKLMSVPIIGDVIGGARSRALEQFQRSAMQRAAPPGGQIQQLGKEGIEEAKGVLGSAYDDLYAGRTVSPDSVLLQRINEAKQSTTLPLNADSARKFDAIVQKTIWQKIPESGEIPAGAAKAQIEADLGRQIRALTKFGTSAEENSLGEALTAVRNAWREAVARTSGAPQEARQGIDKAYAAMKQIESAAEKATAQGGKFTPYQLAKATRPGTDLRKLAEDAQAVLKSTVPNSGTTDRALIAYFLTHPWNVPLAAGGALPIAALYSQPVQKFLQGAVTSPAVQQSWPALTRGAAAYGLLQSEPETPPR